MIKLKNKALTMGLLATAGVLASGFMTSVQAFTRYNLNGVFINGTQGSFTGFFHYDSVNNTIPMSSDLWSLNVTASSPFTSLTYNVNNGALISGNNLGVSFFDNVNRLMSISFETPLTGIITGSVSSLVSGNETIQSGFPQPTRGITTNLSTATAVPFESGSLPVVGATVLFGAGIWAKNKFKRA